MLNFKDFFKYLKRLDTKTDTKASTSKTFFASSSMAYLVLKSNDRIPNKVWHHLFSLF